MADQLVVDRDWVEIPYFRKPWFAVLLFVVFMPAYLLVIWTGDTYYRKKRIVYRTSSKTRMTISLVVVGLTLSFFLRRFH
jgi:hypothetical protein